MGRIATKFLLSRLVIASCILWGSVAAAEQVTESAIGAINLSAYTDPRSMGYMVPEGLFTPLATIKGAEKGSVLIGKGEKVLVEMAQGQKCRAGETFTICRIGSQVKRPDSREVLGWVIDYVGTLELDGSRAVELCSAIVKDSFRPVERGDFLIPTPLQGTSCLEPVVVKETIAVPVAAVKDSMQVIGQFSVVYLAGGEMHGLRKGMLMEILEGSPEEVVGHLIVADVSKNTSVAVVILSKREFHPFVLARSIGPDALDTLLKKASLCRKER